MASRMNDGVERIYSTLAPHVDASGRVQMAVDRQTGQRYVLSRAADTGDDYRVAYPIVTMDDGMVVLGKPEQANANRFDMGNSEFRSVDAFVDDYVRIGQGQAQAEASAVDAADELASRPGVRRSDAYNASRPVNFVNTLGKPDDMPEGCIIRPEVDVPEGSPAETPVAVSITKAGGGLSKHGTMLLGDLQTRLENGELTRRALTGEERSRVLADDGSNEAATEETGEDGGIPAAEEEAAPGVQAETASDAVAAEGAGTSIPQDEGGRTQYESVPVEDTVRSIYDESGLTAEQADAFVGKKLSAARAEAEKVAKKEPQIDTFDEIDLFKKAQETWHKQMDDAERKAAYWQQVKETGDAVRETPADMQPGVVGSKTEQATSEPTVAESATVVDNQGNPVDANGVLVADEISDISELSDEDFDEPTRSVILPKVPENIDKALGANHRPVVIKKSIFEKNGEAHLELSPAESREILKEALYSPNLIGNNQPLARPNYQVAIHLGDKNSVVVLDVFDRKDNVEIVGWRKIDEKGLERMKRRAQKEGGQFLILSSQSDSAAALSDVQSNPSLGSKDTTSLEKNQAENPVRQQYEALLAENEGNEAEALDTARQMVYNTQSELDKARKSETKGKTVDAIQDAKRAKREKIAALEKDLKFWQDVAGYPAARRKVAETERRLNERLAREQKRKENTNPNAGLRQLEADERLGAPLSLREYILRKIATGRVKFHWSGSESGTGGLKEHGGQAKRQMLYTDKTRGAYPEDVAEAMRLDIMDNYPELGAVDASDILSEIEDIAVGEQTPREMMDEAERLHERSLRATTDTEFAEAEREEAAIEEARSEQARASVEGLTDEEYAAVHHAAPRFAGEMFDEDGRPKEMENPVRPSQVRPVQLAEAYKGGNASVIADMERRMRAYIDSSDINDVYSTYVYMLSLKKPGDENMKKAYEYAKKCLKNKLKRDGVPDVLLLKNYDARAKFAETTEDSRWLDLLAHDGSYVVARKIIENPAATDATIKYLAERYAENGVGFDAERELVRRSGIEDADDRFEREMETEGGEAQAEVDAVAEAEAQVDTNPTEKQKEAGNYRKGHVKINGLDITIENPKGSVRSGVDGDGRAWQSTMNNTYGYIRGTEGVDGDHIDVFLSETPEAGDVFVIDQVNPKTGAFDEHKVMYGFGSEEEARAAYLSNYDDGWQGLGTITKVDKAAFKKWLGSSRRKTKPYSEYRGMNASEDALLAEQTEERPSSGKADANQPDMPRYDERPVPFHKGGKRPKGSRRVYELTRDLLRKAGIKVHEVSAEQARVMANLGQRMSAAKKRALDTAVGSLRNGQATVVSSADGAKIRKNLDELSKEYQDKKKSKTFLGDLSRALGLRNNGNQSSYGDFECANGVNVRIRVSDHNAKTKNFDDASVENGISIVVTRKNNQGITDNGDAHIVEYYYNAIQLERADGKPLSDIVRSVQQMLYSGEFVDVTGLAERQEVNGSDAARFHRVYHGTGAKFDAFDFSHIGEGEGAQAYGWGGYVTEVKGIGIKYAESTSRDKDLLSLDHELSWIEAKLSQAESMLQSYREELARERAWLEAKEMHLSWFQQESERLKSVYGEASPQYQEYISNDIYKTSVEVTKDNIQRIEDNINQIEKEVAEFEKEYKDKKDEILQRQSSIQRNLYTVEIPDNTGENYLTTGTTVPKSSRRRIADVVRGMDDSELQRGKHGPNWLAGGVESLANVLENSQYDAQEIRKRLVDAFGAERKASEIMSDAGFVGITYPAQHTTGGRADGARNYVIFKESDMKITDRIQFLQTPVGEVYGWTVGGEVFLNRDAMNPETPLHEYTHLWDDMVRRSNPDLWKRGVALMKKLPLWQEVVDDPNYADIAGDEDAVASEVHSRMTGADGAALLERMASGEGSASPFAGSLFGEDGTPKAEAAGLVSQIKAWLGDMFEALKATLSKWTGKDLEGLTQEQFVRMPLRDLLEGVNPNAEVAVEDEASAIERKAKADGTWLKAPNGKPTKLTPRQWVQVRTRAFKDWFGDWEKAARIEKLRGSKPVEITGDEIEASEDLEQYRKNAEQYAKDLRGSYRNEDTGAEIRLTSSRKNGGIREVLHHDIDDVAHLQSMAAIPQIIEKSTYITTLPNEDTKVDAESFDYYVCGLKIDGEDYTVKSVIVTLADGTRYYDHKLTSIENGDLIDAIKKEPRLASNPISSESSAKPGSLSDIKDKRLLSILQTEASKVVDENGEPLVVYHGTDAAFTEFNSSEDGALGKGMYFSEDIDYAKGVRPNASLYEVYLNIRNPYIAHTPGEPPVKALEKHDGVFATGPHFWVAWQPNQIKSATDNVGTFDAGNADIRFHIEKPVEQKGELVAVHNLSEGKLKEALELGGFPMPSIAITKAGMGHVKFGDISLVFGKETINPTDRRNKVYGEDAWTPTFPQVGHKANDAVVERISKKYYDLKQKHGREAADALYPWANYAGDELSRVGGEAEIFARYRDDTDMMKAYLRDTGQSIPEPIIKETRTRLSDWNIALFDYLIGKLGKDVINETYPNGRQAAEVRKEWNEAHGKALEQAYWEFLSERGFTEDEIENVLSNARPLIHLAVGARKYMNNGSETVKTETDITATHQAIRDAVDNDGYHAWLHGLFDGIEEKRGIRNDKDMFTPSGNRRSFESLYDEITLDNVVKAMKRQSDKGGAGFFNSSIFGAAQKDFKSIDEIRKAARDRMREVEDDEIKNKKKAITDRLSGITIPGNGEKVGDIFDWIENVKDAVAKSHTPQGIHNYLKEFYPGMTMEAAKEIADVVKDIQKMSARYFEAKPYRSVGFEEVKLAVVPDNTDLGIIGGLERRGIPVKTYEHGNNIDRIRVLNDAAESGHLLFRRNSPRFAGELFAEDGAPEASVSAEPSASRTAAAKRAAAESLASRLGVAVEVEDDRLGRPRRGLQSESQGWYDPKTGTVHVNLGNHADAEDVKRTVLHEAVGHMGMRRLFDRKKPGAFDAFLDRVYASMGAEARSYFEAYARKSMAGMAVSEEALRRMAADEYVAALAEVGGEPNVWQRVVAEVRSLLRAMGLDVRMSDADIRALLYESRHNLESAAYYAERELMRREQGIFRAEARLARRVEEDEADDAATDDNARFNEQLHRYESGELRSNEYINVGDPSGVMRHFMPDRPIILRQRVLTKLSKKHGISAQSLRNLPEAIAEPIFVFKSKDNTVSVLTELQSESGENLFVAIALDVNKQMGHEFLEVNDILTIHGREAENIINPIVDNATLQYVDKEKGLEWLSSAKTNSQAIATQTLNQASKIIESFENPKPLPETPLLYRRRTGTMDDSRLGVISLDSSDGLRYDSEYSRWTRQHFRKMATKWERFFLDDSMPVRHLMTHLRRAAGGVVSSATDLWQLMTTVPSKIQYRIEEYERRIGNPLAKTARSVYRGTKDAIGKYFDPAMSDNALYLMELYLQSKHIPERNALMNSRKGTLGMDYAGATRFEAKTGMTPEAYAKQYEKMLSDLKLDGEMQEMWRLINESTSEALRLRLEYGLLSRESYDAITGMGYQYYVPLKGYDEKNANSTDYMSIEYPSLADAYQPSRVAKIHKADGRRSLADDPLPYIRKRERPTLRRGVHPCGSGRNRTAVQTSS